MPGTRQLQNGVFLGPQGEIQMSPLPLPVVYFENAPTMQYLNGIIGVTLTVGGAVPGPNRTVLSVGSVVAHLKCNLAAALALKSAIESALLLAQPVENPDAKPS